ncbi:MAG: hypothetical protein L0332_18005 [Chloroflexi bacterium]|nr:hypothetical protein [Chloroflexota bacterium]MCI0728595.1 hypothetical protein [Chloroflexota bacterium]
MSQVLKLKTTVTFRGPSWVDVHARYALFVAGQAITLPPGTWLLAQLQDQESETLYRTADGRLVALDRPLGEDEATPLNDSQALVAMSAYRPLEQAAQEEWGIHLEHIDRLAPFKLIKCPLCWGIDFASVDFAQVWCNGCGATFTVRMTAGDPGFVVDCFWPYYHWRPARYLMPATDGLLLTLVLKDSGDPLDLTHDEWRHRDDCTPEHVALTGDDACLRPRLHACRIGTLYEWSFYGHVPAQPRNRRESLTVCWPAGRRESWPDTALVKPSGLSDDERHDLWLMAGEIDRRIGSESASYKQGLLDTLNELLERPGAPPYLPFGSAFPDARCLAEGEKYLLHRWLLHRERDKNCYAYSIWLVVRVGSADGEWQVVRGDLCPKCGQAVGPRQPDSADGWPPHQFCQELWQTAGWQPFYAQELAGEGGC